MPTAKVRISVPISPEIAMTIEIESKKIGVSPSTYCAFIIGQHIQAQSNVYGMLSESITTAIENAKTLANLSTLPENEEDWPQYLYAADLRR